LDKSVKFRRLKKEQTTRSKKEQPSRKKGSRQNNPQGRWKLSNSPAWYEAMITNIGMTRIAFIDPTPL